jgi:hypothetical protein
MSLYLIKPDFGMSIQMQSNYLGRGGGLGCIVWVYIS